MHEHVDSLVFEQTNLIPQIFRYQFGGFSAASLSSCQCETFSLISWPSPNSRSFEESYSGRWWFWLESIFGSMLLVSTHRWWPRIFMERCDWRWLQAQNEGPPYRRKQFILERVYGKIMTQQQWSNSSLKNLPAADKPSIETPVGKAILRLKPFNYI